ncbi:MAG: hypothetical protein ABGX26_06550 [Nautiliaceae bacterium]|jgi:cell shape-determining protein MreC
MNAVFIIISIIGFFVPYVLKFLLTSTEANIKIFALFALNKFNLIYFIIIIFFFFASFRKKEFKIAQIIFVTVYLGYILVSYFFLSKKHVEEFIKTHHLTNVKLMPLSKLNTLPNFKLHYKEANWAAVEILKEKNSSLPFNYKKDKAQ